MQSKDPNFCPSFKQIITDLPLVTHSIPEPTQQLVLWSTPRSKDLQDCTPAGTSTDLNWEWSHSRQRPNLLSATGD